MKKWIVFVLSDLMLLIAASAHGQTQMECRQLDGSDNFLQSNEVMVPSTGGQYQACHVVAAKPKTEPAKAASATPAPAPVPVAAAPAPVVVVVPAPAPAPVSTEQTINKNVNFSGEVTQNVKAEVNAPKAVANLDDRPCLIVAAGEHRFNSGSGLIGLAAVAGSKEYWAFRDSYHLDPNLIQTKYKQNDVLMLQKKGIHVVVVDRNSKEVTNARLACQGLTAQQ
jgi:hypothetical protein